MKTRPRKNAMILAVLLVPAVLPGLARAQVGISLAIGNTVAATDALGRILPGSDGNPDGSCRVEIRQIFVGGILAPTDALLDTYNPLMTNSHLGRGVIGDLTGLYAETFLDRSVLATNKSYYARVFDRPPAQTPLYYADTPPFSLPPTSEPSVNAEFGPLKRVDGTDPDPDTDSDGIPDVIETEIIGTSIYDEDSDEDGWDDLFEYLYGSPMDPNDYVPLTIDVRAPEFAGEPPVPVTPYTVSWWSLPGMWYQLEYHPDTVDAGDYEVIDTYRAAADELAVDVDGWVNQEFQRTGFFRVWALPDYEP